ncbi:PREDICTED: ultraviolet-B receptor UVR8 [Nelumbo nucifera]|uniref:Ultraviolet-B receptor UVR8 n=2 Tax=Nelumbo nucifera TaxID=4432 RepID=A0A1U7Z323_NELNU|nr:PREDICTED: ultraviolet-B receptor UVR8 [Nelumbo nucifera]XP_010241666.1 PREDICTED: ultraviolet-B receptor UVR8 [Nelumbo nucifera]DAD39103.1 TPA_asm: hypothetical protein HUJ06_013426 [Nelumbo nucifera]
MMLGSLLSKERGGRVITRSFRVFSSKCRRAAFGVMSWGDGSQGALGLGSCLAATAGVEDAYEPTRIEGLPDDVLSIGAGHYHSLAVTAQGEVWAWGRNNEAQLGRGLSSPRESWNRPEKVLGLNGVRTRAAFASGVVSTAIGEDGSVWVWGKSKRGQLGLGQGITEAVLPCRVEALAANHIVKVSLGWGHALALSKDGQLFGWGYCAEGRLGLIGKEAEVQQSTSPRLSRATTVPPKLSSSALEMAEKQVLEDMNAEKNMSIIWEPRLVEELRGVPVLDIACGLDHSLILCRNNALLSGGNNTYGQLGRSNEGPWLLPVDMPFRPLSISSGLGHSLAVCEVPRSEVDGEPTTAIVSWGWNRSSQLGRPGPEHIPAITEGLAGEIPISVSGGRAHSIALTSKGNLWAWGCGKNGRLGLGSSADEVEPALVESLEGFELLQAVSGFDHSLILVAE